VNSSETDARGGERISTGVHEVTVACRGLRWPRKKAENHIIANDYEVALAA
jgi:hypothetical protein